MPTAPPSAAGRRRLDPELVRRLLRAKDRMAAAPHEDWPVRRLARVGGVSQAHFARCFKVAFGIPPHRYLLSLRLERAKALLRDTALPITDVAREAGWKSLGTFGRTFRAVVGETPSAFRSRHPRRDAWGEAVPACVQQAAYRPALEIAVSEKRRRHRNG